MEMIYSSSNEDIDNVMSPRRDTASGDQRENLQDSTRPFRPQQQPTTVCIQYVCIVLFFFFLAGKIGVINISNITQA